MTRAPTQQSPKQGASTADERRNKIPTLSELQAHYIRMFAAEKAAAEEEALDRSLKDAWNHTKESRGWR